MKIGIDMRMAGTGEGIGRYIEKLVENLAKLDFQNDYYLLCDAASAFADNFKTENPRFKKVKVASRYYSWAEQTSFLGELMRYRLDLVHFASFNAPILYRGRFVTTIHDIIHHLFPGKKKSRVFQRAAYRFAIWASVKRARKVIAVSQATADTTLRKFGLEQNKLAVIPEGVDADFFLPIPKAQLLSVQARYRITKPYLLFVGVWRQYKNLPRLAEAFAILKRKYQRDLQLVLAGKIDPFYPEIKNAVVGSPESLDIRALGYVPEKDLLALYRGAKLFVLPSLVEGFGLIGVEAQASGLPVAASRIPVLEEILGRSAIYFNPLDPGDIAAQLNTLLGDAHRMSDLGRAGQEWARRYDWKKTASMTLHVYNQAMKHSI